MKIPFDIKYRPQIESGEYKVVTGDDRPVRIISWDKKIYGGRYEIVALVPTSQGDTEAVQLYCPDGTYIAASYNEKFKLFIITPEPELTEFEKCMLEFADKRDEYEYDSTNVCELNNQVVELTHTYSKELLAIARKQLKAEGWEYTDPLFKEICDEQSDSNGHLVGDMYVEYAKVKDGKRRCEMDWKEFQQCAKHFYDRGYKDGVRIGKYEAEKNITDELKRILSVSEKGWLERNIKSFIKELEEQK